MSWTWANIDWTTTSPALAAWVQSLGSIAAIVGAIWIDRGSARRAAEERKEQFDREISARIHAVENCAVAAMWAVEVLKAWEPEGPNQHWLPGPVMWRTLTGAWDALRYFLRQPEPNFDARLVITMTQAEQVMETLIENLKANQPVFPSQQQTSIQIFENAGLDIRELVNIYKATAPL